MNKDEIYNLDDRRREFESKIRRDDGCECWTWVGALDRYGYGRFCYNDSASSAHRFSWFMRFGNPGKDFRIRHTCDNIRCVNPAHLEKYQRPQKMRDWSQQRKSDHFWSFVACGKPEECWLWKKNIGSHGYGTYVMEGVKNAHRVAYTIARGKIPAGMAVCHKCDVRACCNPDHFFLGTLADNNRDMFQKGRNRTKPRSNITEDQVRFIRSIYVPNKMTMRKIATDYGFPYYSVKCAVDKAKWKHVK